MGRRRSKEEVSQAVETTPRRGWLRLGPGFLASLVVVAGLVGHKAWQQRVQHRDPPLVQSRVVAGPGPPGRFTPEVSVLLDNAGELELSAEQKAGLQALSDEYAQVSKPLSEELDSASRAFETLADQQTKAGTGNLADLQRNAEPVSELSRQYGSLRREYWRRAVALLSAEQRSVAENLRRDSLQRRVGSQ